MRQARLDTPGENDNRAYDYSRHKVLEREEYSVIAAWIPPRSRVIDLGCGNGSLLELLQRTKAIEGFGIERAPSGVKICAEKGLKVIQGEIDQPLKAVPDEAYDYAICNVTMQMVMYPEVLLSEMTRIARFQITSFPNFANIKNRFDLLMRGRMPRPMLFGYAWYNTGHIHQFSDKDFLALIADKGLIVKRAEYLGGFAKLGLARFVPNLFATTCIYETRRK